MSFIYKIIKQKGLNHKIKSINNNIQRWVGFGHFIKVGGEGGGENGRKYSRRKYYWCPQNAK